MTDDITHVETAGDLSTIPGRDAEAVATLLSEGAPGVVWVREWLADEKPIEPAQAHPQLAVGRVDDYSAKAFRLRQPPGNEVVYVPKSAAVAFVLADGVDGVETPQQAIGEFE